MRLILFAAALAAASLRATAASASLVVDVDNLAVDPSFNICCASAHQSDAFFGFRTAQTWTVGVAGSLATIDLVGQTNSPPDAPGPFDVTLSVFRGAGTDGWGSGALVGSLTRSSTDIPSEAIATFDFSGFAIQAAVGEVFTWQMSVEPCVAPCFRTWSNTIAYDPSGIRVPAYAGGTAYAYSPSIGLIEQFDDTNFRITMDAVVDPVPEPSAWALMALGFAVAGAGLRRCVRRPSAAV